ncbi:MAG: NADH-quinone oxidoreductase subunit J [Proteobacteria bacterium]|nr:NADH-quinone oxidoreductase subunit J [Pseudomonadota bacterium]
MPLTAIAFYLLAIVTVVSGFMVITARNPVHSVLYLILCFFSGAGLFVLLGAEFLAMLLVVVYVGAVAVLFLFVVMMLDVDFARLREGYAQYLPLGLVVAAVLLGEMVTVSSAVANRGAAAANATPQAADLHVSNTQSIGQVLYTDYIYFFQAAGIVLLIAMIGAIVLTLRHKPSVRRQKIHEQVGRRRRDAVEVTKVGVGEGISE